MNFIMVITKNLIAYKENKKKQQPKRARGTEDSIVVVVDTNNREKLSRFLSKIRRLFPDLSIQRKVYTAKEGDVIIIGSTENKEDISLLRYRGEGFVGTDYDVYFLTKKQGVIIRRIEEYYESAYNLACEDCPYNYNRPSYRKDNSLKDLRVKNIIFDGQFINHGEKVSIGKDYVKIGYDFYPVSKRFGKKTIKINNNIYRISTDKNDNKFLREF